MLNFRQLRYFWTVAGTGSIARASERLHVTPQTISAQIGELERDVGTDLFRRVGRRLELTSAGRLAQSYAEEIFQTGSELEAALRNPAAAAGQAFRVGLADVVPKSIAYRLLAPAMALEEPVRLICHENKLDRLFGDLAIHQLDLVIADRALPSEMGVRGFSHPLGQSSTVFLAAPELARRYRKDFPQSLHEAPMLLPATGAASRAALGKWFAEQRLVPRIVGEFDDTALIKAFGQAGAGIFPSATVYADEVQQQYKVEMVGVATSVIVKYFAISMERKVTHPAVAAVCEGASRAMSTDAGSRQAVKSARYAP